MIAQNNYSRLLISHETTNRQVHKWRSEEASILVGTNTALLDNPSLTNRLWPGKNPIRLVIDSNLKIQATSHLLDGSVQTIVFNSLRQEQAGAILYYKIAENKSWVLQITEALYQMNIQSLLVEGGATLLQSFIDENYWDEARVITNTEMEVSDGLKAPRLKNAEKYFSETIEKDLIQYYRRITAG